MTISPIDKNRMKKGSVICLISSCFSEALGLFRGLFPQQAMTEPVVKHPGRAHHLLQTTNEEVFMSSSPGLSSE